MLALLDQTIVHSGIYENQEISLYSVLISLTTVLRAFNCGTAGTNFLCGVLWYICTLVLCYDSYYWVCRQRKKGIPAYTGISATVVVLALTIIINGGGLSPIIYQNARGFAGFFIGVLLYEVYNRYHSEKISNYLGAFVLFIALLSIYKGADKILGNVSVSLVLVIYPMIILFTIHNGVVNKVFQNSVLQHISMYSTAFYVSHGETIHLISMCNRKFNWWLDFSSPKIFWIIYLLCAVVSVIMFYIIKWTAGQIAKLPFIFGE